MSNKIIKGYKGIMDLDLTNVKPELHKSLIDQHYKDIDDFIKEQSKLDPEKRYENTIGKAKEKLEYYNIMTAKRFYNPEKFY